MNIQNRRGIAMIFTLFFVVNVIVLETAFIMTTMQGAGQARMERDSMRAFYAAHGGAEEALKTVDTLINGYLQDTILNADPTGVGNYAVSKVNAHDGIGWLVNAVRNDNVPVLAQSGTQAVYNGAGTLNGTAYAWAITFTGKGDPVSVGSEAWDFPFAFRIDVTGTQNGTVKQVGLDGDFTVRVQRDNFAKFALFTNTQQVSGTNVWFTDKTAFYGPVHTNDRFNFARVPGGTFFDTISQRQQTARFYNNNNPVLIDASANGVQDVPDFRDTFSRGVAQVTLNSATEEADMISQARGATPYFNNGIYLPNAAGALTNGIYVRGNASVTMTVDALDRAVYRIVQGAFIRDITVDTAANQTLVRNVSTGAVTTYNGVPDGTENAGTIVYVDGSITALSGTVQRDTLLTVASKGDTTISGNVLYEDFTPGVGTPGDAGYVPPTAAGADNILGIVSWNGSVRIGTTAPDNVQIHGTVLAENGVFTVTNYDNYDVRGVATLLGGVITNEYGAFGLFNSATGANVSGYGRNFVYDGRMEQGATPPYFPSLETFIAFTNDIADKIVWQEVKG